MSLVDTVLNISSAMQAMLDFMAEDENLGNDFEEFLKKYSIEIVNQNQLTKIMLFYVFCTKICVFLPKTKSYTINFVI